MAGTRARIWFDPEGDFLEVTFDQRPGDSRVTENETVMEKVDDQGNVLGFSAINVSELKMTPLEVTR